MNTDATFEKPIDVQAEQALVVREHGAVGRAMTIDELHRNLEFIRDVMRKEMREGQDYGKIPGAGEKPCLLQPGAQKLLMTFNLTECVKKEVLREYPPYHREYEFTVSVQAGNGKTWDGVGTCSTLESKYRYRKAERRCPKCGKNTIIAGKAEYGGGWLCWAKKGGCGAKFDQDAEAIVSQPGGQVENENPADQWNTVRKMAFKRALVSAAINATNTSELWTQDIEEGAEDGLEASKAPQTRVEPSKPAKPCQDTAPTTKTPQKPPSDATESFRTVMLKRLDAGPGGVCRDLVTGYFRAIDGLLETEQLEELPLSEVPVSKEEFEALKAKLAEFENGDKAERAFPRHLEAEAKKPEPAKQPKEDQWWRDIIVPIPHKGQSRAEYLKSPETLGSLYESRHGDDENAQIARQRLWGFVTNYQPKPWTKRDGTQMPPSEADVKFREALDAFLEFFKREHPDEKL